MTDSDVSLVLLGVRRATGTVPIAAILALVFRLFS